MHKFSWVGSQKHFVDLPDIQRVSNIIIGRFGGNSSAGQYKNEDGCLVWSNEENDWDFVMLLDAHNSAESAELVVNTITREEQDLVRILNKSLPDSFIQMEENILRIFQNPMFLASCRETQGETACLIVVRKGKYVWWFSVGDCILHLFHPELAKMEQYLLNQRNFFEWIGYENTFELEVPCYSMGRRELRKGMNHLFLTTDGLTECPNGTFHNPVEIMKAFDNSESHQDSVMHLLKEIEERGVRDSTTIISWVVDVEINASEPSNL
ncbi:protein phosphatase 2C domain-containing protein [Psychrobacillus antarcticus]|uniref:protein phosphatase 2C domain-containing protein n=1 Tax=Psychrobacillus antarcticus TaxID=2879115 RepID=UPI0024087637|nr:protein phosphatase 2C domain-containing protein [Psychrobacillus antarcticus]